jgi:hypothetical protein
MVAPLCARGAWPVNQLQDTVISALRKRLRLPLVFQDEDCTVGLRRLKRRDDRVALKQWRGILERLTNERGAWGVGIEAAAAFARRWAPLRRAVPEGGGGAGAGMRPTASMHRYVHVCRVCVLRVRPAFFPDSVWAGVPRAFCRSYGFRCWTAMCWPSARCGAVWYGVVRCSAVHCVAVWCCAVRCGVAARWCGAVRWGAV